MSRPKGSGIMAGVLAVSLSYCLAARAEFELPLLGKVPKILSVPDVISGQQLSRFSEVRDLSIEIRLEHGNSVPGFLFAELQDRFGSIPKRVVLSGNLSDLQVEQLRKLEHLEVTYLIPSGGPDPKILDRLYALGPVRKTYQFPVDFNENLVQWVGHQKYCMLSFSVGVPNDERNINWLARERKMRKLALLPADATPNTILDLAVLSPLSLEIQTIKNRIPDPLIQILKDMKGVEITLVVDGRVTLEDAKQWSLLPRFTLKVMVRSTDEITPGLGQLLNRISPP